MKAEEFIKQKAVGGSQAASDKQYLEVGDVERLLQMVRQEAMSPISIHGRKYVTVPYHCYAHIPTALVNAVAQRPDRDDVEFHIAEYADRLLCDIIEYLRDALAVTAWEEASGDENFHAYRLELPVLMPADTRDRWSCENDEEFLAYEERLRKAEAERRTRGGYYPYKMVELTEEEKEALCV